MRLLQIMTVIAFGTLLAACGDNAEQLQAQQETWEEMMEVHDEVMPKMGEISRLRRELTAKMEALDSTETEQIETIDATLAQLDGADIGMMDWMGDLQQLSTLRENNSHDEIMAYLEQEKEKVQKVKENMLSAIEAGKQMLDSFGEDTEQNEE